MVDDNPVEHHIKELTKMAKRLIDQMGNEVEEGGNKGKIDFP